MTSKANSVSNGIMLSQKNALLERPLLYPNIVERVNGDGVSVFFYPISEELCHCIVDFVVYPYPNGPT